MQLIQIYFNLSRAPKQPHNEGGKDNSDFLLATLGLRAS